MSERVLLIEPHDPVIFRDGRPFTEGSPATTLPFPLPSATVGAIRSRSGENLDFEKDAVLNHLLSIRQVGPFPASFDSQSGRWELAFPVPADAVPYRVSGEIDGIEYDRLRPDDLKLPPGGCDLPIGVRPLSGGRPEKVCEEAPRFWRAGFMLDWLSNKPAVGGKIDPRQIGFNALPVQQRTHVAIDTASLLARDGMLYTTAGLEFTWPADGERECRLRAQRAGIVSRISSDTPLQFPTVAPLGGERRLAIWRELPDSEIAWPAPPKLSGGFVRVVLVTPAIFSQGWRPSWSQPPETKDLEMELVAAAVPRFQPVSGWDLHKARRGPKPTRFLAPAGSVYFFQCKGDPAQLWMRSICDAEQDRRDGYGIVLIGDC
jgi:CRISPR-associated protein Cmr3